MATGSPTTLVVVAGLPDEATATLTEDLRATRPGTVSMHHDLSRVAQGIVLRRLRSARQNTIEVLELAHGCVSCTLREDVLPMLGKLAAIPDVRRIVLRVDPVIEPDAVCWAIQQSPVDNLEIEAIVTAIDARTWLAAATDDRELSEHGLAVTPEDERTLAQVAVGQVEFADALVLVGATDAKTRAVLDRLAPRAPRARLADLDPAALLERIPLDARRGAPDDPHGPVLLGQPPLDIEEGVTTVLFHEARPFHPGRLQYALDALLDGVVRTRGRIWLASQPDAVLWLESAGGGLNLGRVGEWLAASDPEQWPDDPPRRAMAALRWHPYYGDRAQDLAILVHEGDAQQLLATVRAALLTDSELAQGWSSWPDLPDPFGAWHAELSSGMEEE
ncbi:MAG TPA: GTP-binding protein [Pseudonocardiaceae bacterium]